MNLKPYLSHPLSTAGKVRSRVADQLVQAKVVKGQSNYVKFIILGWYRTGSNLLVTSLSSHPQAIAYSEIFFPKRIFWGNGIYGKRESQALIQQRADDSERFIKDHVFRPYPEHIKAVGFKIFYPQIEHPSFKNLSDYIFADTGIKVIHLRRRNLLQVFVSQKVAQQTGAMTEVSSSQAKTRLVSVGPIELTHEECCKYFESMCESADRYDHEFRQRGHEMFNLYYEDMIADTHLLENLQLFLGLEPRVLSSRLVKQNTRRLADLVKNFDDLKRGFKGSQWENFFE